MNKVIFIIFFLCFAYECQAARQYFCTYEDACAAMESAGLVCGFGYGDGVCWNTAGNYDYWYPRRGCGTEGDTCTWQYQLYGCCQAVQCSVSATASTGGEVCDVQENCGTSLNDTDQCGNQYVAVPDSGWAFSHWNVPPSTDECTYSCEGDTCTVEAMSAVCSTVTAYFTKVDNEELCDFYPAHDDYAVQVTGSKKTGSCYEGITVVTSEGDSFSFSFTQTHDSSQNTAAPLDSPWMTAEDWKEFCANSVMPSQYCFDTSNDTEEPPDLTPPPPIDPVEPLEESPDQQDPEDQGEWAINDNLGKLDSNEQKRAEGIKASIDAASNQNHSDLKAIDANSDKRTDEIVAAIRGIKFTDKDDTDEDKLLNGMQDYWNQQGDTISQVEQSLPEHTVQDYVNEGVTFSDEEISVMQTEFEIEQTNYENKFEEFVNNLSTNEIAQKFKVQMQNPDCSFSVNMMGNEILFSFCSYGEILAMMGNWLIFISYVSSLYMVLKA